MTGQKTTIRRVDRVYRGKPTHHYEDLDRARVPGVTNLIGDGFPKPALINWAGNATADYAVNNWDSLSEKGPADRVKELRGARFADRDKAARRGTEIHKLGEQLVRGEEVTVPDELAGHVEAYVRWLDTFAPDPVLIEAVVYSERFRYAGTLDLVADLPCLLPDCPNDRDRWLLDLKSNRSGVYGETALQLAAYRYADFYVDHDGLAQRMPDVAHCGVVWVRGDGADLVPVEATEATFMDFRYVARVARLAGRINNNVGEALTIEGAVA